MVFPPFFSFKDIFYFSRYPTYVVSFFFFFLYFTSLLSPYIFCIASRNFSRFTFPTFSMFPGLSLLLCHEVYINRLVSPQKHTALITIKYTFFPVSFIYILIHLSFSFL